MRRPVSAAASRRHVARTLCAVGIALLAATGSAMASEGEKAKEAVKFLRGFGDEAIAMLSDRGLSADQRRSEFRQLIKAGFELPAISRFVLGRHWHKATAQERQEFAELFEDFVTITYAKRLSDYSGETLKLGGAKETDAKGMVFVDSKILRPAKTDIEVVWRLRQSAHGWRIIDLVVEGVSMLQTQRSEFDAVIRSGGGHIGALLERLRSATKA